MAQVVCIRSNQPYVIFMQTPHLGPRLDMILWGRQIIRFSQDASYYATMYRLGFQSSQFSENRPVDVTDLSFDLSGYISIKDHNKNLTGIMHANSLALIPPNHFYIHELHGDILVVIGQTVIVEIGPVAVGNVDDVEMDENRGVELQNANGINDLAPHAPLNQLQNMEEPFAGVDDNNVVGMNGNRVVELQNVNCTNESNNLAPHAPLNQVQYIQEPLALGDDNDVEMYGNRVVELQNVNCTNESNNLAPHAPLNQVQYIQEPLALGDDNDVEMYGNRVVELQNANGINDRAPQSPLNQVQNIQEHLAIGDDNAVEMDGNRVVELQNANVAPSSPLYENWHIESLDYLLDPNVIEGQIII